MAARSRAVIPLKNRMIMKSFYVHSPYCLHKCGYCDFNSFATDPASQSFRRESRRYVQCLLKEANLWSDFFAREFHSNRALDFDLVDRLSSESLFFGGGTPTLLPPDALKYL